MKKYIKKIYNSIKKNKIYSLYFNNEEIIYIKLFPSKHNISKYKFYLKHFFYNE